MKLKIVLMTLAFLAATACLLFWRKSEDKRKKYEALLERHPFTQILRAPSADAGEENEVSETDRPDLAMMQDFLQTMDPVLLRPTPEVLWETNVKTAQLRDHKFQPNVPGSSLSNSTTWTERGPLQVGGRTRAIMFDPNDVTSKKVWAGGVSGGLWYNNDITNANSAWVKVNDFWDNLAVSCMASDPVNSNTFYVGTGEEESTVRGGGIWKTTDGGATWARLTSTQSYLEIRDLVVRNEGGKGVVYVAVRPGYGNDNPVYTAGLFRSADGGTSWQQVLPFAQGSSQYTNLPTDIKLGNDNTLWVGTEKHYWVNTANSTIYKSTTGLLGSWTAYNTFTTSNLTFTGQAQLAIAPSAPSTVYAAFEEGGKIGSIMKTTSSGSSWTNLALPVEEDTSIPTGDFTRGQAGYDLELAVVPTDPNNCIIGGIDLFQTYNGGGSWVQISKWWNFTTTQSYSVIHADQHALVFRPGFPNELVAGNDGGIFYCNNLSSAATSATFNARNLNYNVTQFYTAALHPTSQNYMLSGAQDNGTQKFTQAGIGNTTDVFGGDGAMCFIDQQNPNFQIASYVYNQIGLSTDGGNSFGFGSYNLINDGKTGSFINAGDYDSNQKALYTARTKTSIYRVRNVTSTILFVLDSVNVNLGSMATAFRVSPYTTSSSTVMIGTAAGRLFKMANATSTTPTVTEITGPSFPTGSISCVAFGASENQVMVTFFNYGVISIWETRDGGSTWVNREGNLPNMPVRWAEYHPQNFDQVFIATELGVWSTDNLNVTAPVWNSTNGGLANVRTSALRIRKSDGTIMASTFGRGVFTATIPAQLSQVITFQPVSSKTLGDAPFQLSASSTSALPVTFSTTSSNITINGSTVTLVAPGSVTVNANQSGNNYFSAAPSIAQSFCINPPAPVVTSSALGTASPVLTSNATAGNQWYHNGTAISGATSSTLNVTAPGTYTVVVKVDSCKSVASSPQIFVITDLLPSSESALVLYPIPAKSDITIDLNAFKSGKEVMVKIIDMTGRVSEMRKGNGGESITVSVSNYTPGKYIVSAAQESKVLTHSFTKE